MKYLFTALYNFIYDSSLNNYQKNLYLLYNERKTKGITVASTLFRDYMIKIEKKGFFS